MEEIPSYSKAFKLETVRLLLLSDIAASQVVPELGGGRNQLYKWRDQLSNKGEKAAFSGPGRHAGQISGKAPSTGEQETTAATTGSLKKVRLEPD